MIETMTGKSAFGVVGLGVMGQNLALNVERNGFPVAGFDLDGAKQRQMAAKAAGKNVQVAGSMRSSWRRWSRRAGS